MRTTFLAFAVLAGAGLLAGCQAPRLESRPLTEAEKAWVLTVKHWYPAWEPPYLAPVRKPHSRGADENGSGPDIEPVPASDRDLDLPDTRPQ
jgi:hypothetical protein